MLYQPLIHLIGWPIKFVADRSDLIQDAHTVIADAEVES